MAKIRNWVRRRWLRRNDRQSWQTDVSRIKNSNIHVFGHRRHLLFWATVFHSMINFLSFGDWRSWQIERHQNLSRAEDVAESLESSKMIPTFFCLSVVSLKSGVAKHSDSRLDEWAWWGERDQKQKEGLTTATRKMMMTRETLSSSQHLWPLALRHMSKTPLMPRWSTRRPVPMLKT